MRRQPTALSGPFRSCEDTLKWLDGRVPDAAILDIQLSDEPCTDRARAGIPWSWWPERVTQYPGSGSPIPGEWRS
jgi:hypothetical protein